MEKENKEEDEKNKVLMVKKKYGMENGKTGDEEKTVEEQMRRGGRKEKTKDKKRKVKKRSKVRVNRKKGMKDGKTGEDEQKEDGEKEEQT